MLLNALFWVSSQEEGPTATERNCFPNLWEEVDPCEAEGRLWWLWECTLQISNCKEYNWPRAPATALWIPWLDSLWGHTSCRLLPANDWVWQRNWSSWEMGDSSWGWLCLRTPWWSCSTFLNLLCSLRCFHPAHLWSFPLSFTQGQIYLMLTV